MKKFIVLDKQKFQGKHLVTFNKTTLVIQPGLQKTNYSHFKGKLFGTIIMLFTTVLIMSDFKNNELTHYFCLFLKDRGVYQYVL